MAATPQAELNKQANALISFYLTLYKKKYGETPTLNRYREKWGFISMIEDLGVARAKEVMEFYFDSKSFGHGVVDLLRNYDNLHNRMNSIERDRAERERLRKETKKRVEEWEAALGNQGRDSS